jgi:hypothetical protein
VRRRPQGVGEGAALTLSAEPVVAVTPVAVSRASEKERLLRAVAFGVCLTALAALWFLIPAGISWLGGLLLHWPALPAGSPQSGLYRGLEHLLTGNSPGDRMRQFDFDSRLLLFAPLLGVIGFVYSFGQSGPSGVHPTAHGKLPNHGTKG